MENGVNFNRKCFMDIIYTDMNMPSLESLQGRSSIFLVGPTPRSQDVLSWRPEAIEALMELNFGGFLFVPEYSNWKAKADYLSQVNWERFGLENSSIIAAWVPRDLRTMPAFTTNIEIGRYVTSGRLLYGRPDGSPKTKYLDWLYKEETGKDPHNNLRELMSEAVISLG